MELESVQIPNFLSENRVDKLLNVYFKACKILGCKIHELRLDGGVVSYITGTKVTEFDCLPPSREALYLNHPSLAITFKNIIKYRKVCIVLKHSKNDKEFQIKFLSNFFLLLFILFIFTL